MTMCFLFLAYSPPPPPLLFLNSKNRSMQNEAGGVDPNQTGRQGGWSVGGTQNSPAYAGGAPPKDALLYSAGFPKGDSYWLPRADLEPPAGLLAMLFPWVEDCRKSLLDPAWIKENRLNGSESTVLAELAFLDVLVWFRCVLFSKKRCSPDCLLTFAYATALSFCRTRLFFSGRFLRRPFGSSGCLRLTSTSKWI